MLVNEKIKTVVAVSVVNHVAEMRIVDYIGDSESGTDSRSIAASVNDALAQNVKEASVYINSRGGSVFEATEIANELAKFDKVTIRVGALAASAATYLTSKFYTIAQPNSQFMFHQPMTSVYGNIAEVQSALKMLQNITDDYVSAYVQKTGNSKENIESMLAKGDTWMNATEAKKQGFIDEISTQKTAATVEDVAVLTACGAPHIPDLKTQNKNSNKMERLQIIAALKLAADATDEQIQEALKNAKTNADLYAAMQAKEGNEKKQKARALALKAVQDKKIDATAVDVYAEIAEGNYEACQKALEAMTPIPQLSAELRGKAKGEPDAAHKDWTMQDYLDKDPEALAKLYDESPEVVAQLEAAYFGKK